jgi:hypothetical protein
VIDDATVSDNGAPRVIQLEMPEVDGERVVFRWSEPTQSPWQHRHSFEVVYPGLSMKAHSTELLVDIFLSLQWRVFSLYPGRVRIDLPIRMPRACIEWWQGFHAAPNVDAGPLMEGGYSAWSAQPVVSGPRAIAAFFGAGKDSTLARSLLAEIHGEDQLLLVQMVHPFMRSTKSRNQLRTRQRQLMIDPVLAGSRLDAQMIETDYLANLTKAGLAARPHTNLYVFTSLPVLLSRGVRTACMSNERTAYWLRRDSNGRESVGYARSRPEVYSALSEHLAEAADISISFGNTHFPISEFLSYKILYERYPAAFEKIVMCVVAGPDRRWCMSCKKCAQYVHFGLLCGRRHPDVDYDGFWASSKYVMKALAHAESGSRTVPPGQNHPWHADVSHSYHFASFCHTMARLRDLARGLPAAAQPLVQRLTAAWGNRTFESIEVVSADAVDLVGTDMMRSIAAIFAQHAPMRAGAFRKLPYMNVAVDYDFSRKTDRFGRLVAS